MSYVGCTTRLARLLLRMLTQSTRARSFAGASMKLILCVLMECGNAWSKELAHTIVHTIVHTIKGPQDQR